MDACFQQEGIEFSFATRSHYQSESAWMINLPGPPNYNISMPAKLPGARCYTDASISPHTSPQVPRRAGIGIFIVTSYAGITATIYVKAICQECNSVLMAEATTLALGAKILNAMQGPQPFFLSHNQQLANFLNGKKSFKPSDLGD